MNSLQKQQVEDLLEDFDIQLNKLRKKFHKTLQKYEAHRLNTLKKLVSQIKNS